uniref:Ig-like domain-containing protein n=1 Tax=Anopheles coluzzii TaxID=1518534 RepID=A0A8W7PRG9_ANOCL
MTSLRCFKHQCNSVALATIVLLLTMMIDVREQTMLTEHPPTTEEDLHYSKQITSNSRIQSPTMSSVPPTTPPSLQSSPSPQPTSTAFWSEMSSTSATLPVTPLHMAAVPLPSSLTVSAESLIRDVTSAVTDASTHSLPEAVAMHGADPGPMVTTHTAPSSARASPSGTLLGGVSSDSASTAAQYGGSNAYNKYTTFRPLLIPTLPDVRRSRIVHSMPYQSKHHHERHWGPFFEEPVNVTSGAALQVGYHLSTEAILNCRVGMLKDKTVMWIRRTTDKVSLLTVGNNTYSGDPRIKVKFQYPNNWRLHINPIKSDDAGLYMCQVSTHPPRVFATNLTVLEPAVRIVDEMGYEFSDRYYKLGSTIEISCQVSTSYLASLPPSPKSAGQQQRSKTSPVGAPANTLDETAKTGSKATKDDNKLSDSTERRLISWTKDGAELPKDVKMSFSGTKQWLISRISILQANRVHNGVYNCTVAGKQSQAAQVQVLNGETPAAVQHNFGHRKEATGLVGLHCTVVAIIWCTLQNLGPLHVY